MPALVEGGLTIARGIGISLATGGIGSIATASRIGLMAKAGFFTAIAMRGAHEGMSHSIDAYNDFKSDNYLSGGINVLMAGASFLEARAGLSGLPKLPKLHVPTPVINGLSPLLAKQRIVLGKTVPKALHDVKTPWHKFLQPKYKATIQDVVTQGRSPQDIARTWTHELQHVKDIEHMPGITHLAARAKYFPGSGFARYFLEVRGYHAGGELASPLTPFLSFNSRQVRWFVYDSVILGVGGTGAVYSIFNWWSDD